METARPAAPALTAMMEAGKRRERRGRGGLWDGHESGAPRRTEGGVATVTEGLSWLLPVINVHH